MICRPIHLFYASGGFQKYQKIFNQKIYPKQRCDSIKFFVLLWTFLFKKATHLSLNNHSVPLLKLLMSTENKLKRKLAIVKEKKLGACVKGAKEKG